MTTHLSLFLGGMLVAVAAIAKHQFFYIGGHMYTLQGAIAVRLHEVFFQCQVGYNVKNIGFKNRIKNDENPEFSSACVKNGAFFFVQKKTNPRNSLPSRNGRRRQVVGLVAEVERKEEELLHFMVWQFYCKENALNRREKKKWITNRALPNSEHLK